MLVSENANNVSMLKVLGYDRRRIGNMILNGNHLMRIPGLIIGILTAYGMMAWYSASFVETEGLIIPVALTIPHIVLTVGCVTLCYFISLAMVRRKIEKIDMVESLNDHRE